jgi:hypothetical protein
MGSEESNDLKSTILEKKMQQKSSEKAHFYWLILIFSIKFLAFS